MYIENVKDFVYPKKNEILDEIMVRANDRCITSNTKVACIVLDKIFLSYSNTGTQARKFFYNSIAYHYTSVESNEIIIPEVVFEDERKKIIENCHLNNIEYSIPDDNLDANLDLDIVLINILLDLSWPIDVVNILTKKDLHLAGHWLRQNKSVNIKNIICRKDYSSYNELLKYTKEDDGLISKNKMKIYSKYSYGDVKFKKYLYDESILLLPKKSQTGAFYLFDKNTNRPINSFSSRYYYLQHLTSFGACFFENGQFASIGKKGF